MSLRIFQFFFPDAALFCFSWPLRENSTTELRPVHTEWPRFPNSLPGAPYHHRTGSPAVSPDKLKLKPTQTLSAARILALRDRGLRSISSSLAVTGFLVSSRYQPCFAPSRSASLTILSSSE